MAGTSNVRNGGIAHLAFRTGGDPFCKSYRAHMVVTSDNRMGYPICKRCEAKLAKMQAATVRRNARIAAEAL